MASSASIVISPNRMCPLICFRMWTYFAGWFGEVAMVSDENRLDMFSFNVCLRTCVRLNGVQLIADCFDFQDLPIIIAHSLITIVCNLKMWLNVRSIITMFIPLRSKVLRYMCNMSDKDLRTPTIKLISGMV